MIEVGLRAHLAAEVGSVGGRIYPKKLPQNVPYPALTYEVVSDPRGHTHEGPDGRVEARIQITPWSPQYAAVAAASEQVRQALDGFQGQLGSVHVAFARHVGGRDLYDEEVHVHHRPVDFIIQYTED